MGEAHILSGYLCSDYQLAAGLTKDVTQVVLWCNHCSWGRCLAALDGGVLMQLGPSAVVFGWSDATRFEARGKSFRHF